MFYGYLSSAEMFCRYLLSVKMFCGYLLSKEMFMGICHLLKCFMGIQVGICRLLNVIEASLMNSVDANQAAEQTDLSLHCFRSYLIRLYIVCRRGF